MDVLGTKPKSRKLFICDAINLTGVQNFMSYNTRTLGARVVHTPNF